MYKYYQTKEKGTWNVVTDSSKNSACKDTADKVLAMGAKKLSVLAVSEAIDEYTDVTQLSYKGPLYFDIDCKEDIYLAIRSAKELVAKLLAWEVKKECILIFCSGSKGLHIMVDDRAFSSGRAIRMLPKVYKEMARALFVFGMDYQVYCAKKGNSFRLPNIKRYDGNFRVCVTHEELDTLTVEEYKRMVSGPRILLSFPTVVDKAHSPQLATLFERGRQTVAKTDKKREKIKSNLSPRILDILKAGPPACVLAMLDGKRISNSANFNEIALQMSKYLATADAADPTIAELSGKLSEVTSSSSYTTARDRLQHIQGLTSYCKHSGTAYQFSCAGVKSILTGANPCPGCGIDGEKTELEKEMEEGGSGIIEKDGSYFVAGIDSERKITNFTLTLLDYHTEQQQDGSIERRTGAKALLKSSSINCSGEAEIFIAESIWRSKSNLVNEIEGIGDLMFLGTDMDVQRIKNHVFSASAAEEAGKITAVFTAGIIRQKIGSSNLMVYVEPEGSVNQIGVRDTHHLNADVVCPPELLNQPIAETGSEETSKVMLALLGVNTDHKVGTILGWHSAVHFKTHFSITYNQFPLLSLWGPAGAGKSKTAELFCFLNGCNYTAEWSPINAAKASEWTLIDYCSSTTTSPRILDEANETKMRGRYFPFAEILKSAWGNIAIARGTIKKSGGSSKGRTGARTVLLPISSPLITLSEQSLTMPALQQRTNQVFLTKEGRDKPECYEAFEYAMANRKILKGIGKALMIKALNTRVETVEAAMVETLKEVPKQYDDRPRFSFAVLLYGLDSLSSVCKELKMTSEVLSAIAQKRAAVVTHIAESLDEILQEKSRTDVDLILSDLGHMAAITQAGMSKELLEGVHYMLHPSGDLLLEYKTAFPLYTNWCAKNRKDVVIRDVRQFRALIGQEPYFREEGRVPGFSKTVLVLDGAALTKKGVDLTMFSPSGLGV